jgi:hypothetical protein
MCAGVCLEVDERPHLWDRAEPKGWREVVDGCFEDYRDLRG